MRVAAVSSISGLLFYAVVLSGGRRETRTDNAQHPRLRRQRSTSQARYLDLHLSRIVGPISAHAAPHFGLSQRGDIARCDAEAIAVSANPHLEGTLRSNYWRFSGRSNADGAVRLAGGRSLADATAKVSARHPNLGPIELPMR